MYTALHAASQTLSECLRQRLKFDSILATYFNPVDGGAMVVSLNTPQEIFEVKLPTLKGGAS